ncbi:AAHS family 4-hydroxybenzoate transporter-like MFS transporter [Neisseria perflava]|uniref:MFS transporter n=1 Tax=Neisseria perflava TaxID=33053 RepID=UPI00209CBE7B|nr:MFS transporter [Neisseria perflava]MCP1772124.1 AAHS family 4-hydroxybenzoate transporter-like MFS transporter [Neisseria perflava]
MQTAGRTLNVQDFLNQNRFSPYQWLIFAICFLIAFFDGMDTAAIGYIAPSLLDDWGLEKKQLAPVLSAALFGLAIGAVSFGPVADKIGRKVVLTFSVILFSATCVASAFTENLMQMTVLRFITGLGLGAAMPNAVTLLAEYCPDKKRSLIVNTMYCGFPVGAAAGGFFASWLIPAYGWRTALMWCGLLPLILGFFMIFLLPRSAAYMVVKKYPQERIRKILNRINPRADLSRTEFVVTEKKAADSAANPMALVLGKELRAGSILLWICYFMGLIIFYAMINWMPVLFKEANMPPTLGPKIAGLFALGGLGAIASGWLMSRYNGNKLIALISFLTAVSVAFIGWSLGHSLWMLIFVVLFAGIMQNTAQTSLPALAAQFYPTACRTTGVSWMLGIGRMGAIAGTFLTGQLLAWKLDFVTIFVILAIPSLILTVCLLIKQKIYDGAY